MADAHIDHDHQHGQMEIGEQVSTYKLFMTLTKWASLAMVIMILFPTLWFRPGGDFMTGLIVSVIVLVLGIVILRDKKTPAH